MIMEILNLLRERHGLDLPDEKLLAIVNTCAEIIIVIDQQEYDDAMAAAIDEAGGCSRCEDLDGFSCACSSEEQDYETRTIMRRGRLLDEGDYEHEDDICGNCGEIADERMPNGLCPTCHKRQMGFPLLIKSSRLI